MSAYAELLKELQDMETLAKAMPNEGADDAKIKAAAAAGEAGEADGDEETDEEREEREEREAREDEEGKDEGDPMGKSFTATINGEEVEAIDGTALVKALMGRIDESESDLAKALGAAVSMLKSTSATVTKQAKEISLLKSQVAAIGSQGAGRKTTLSISDKAVAGVADKAPSLTAEAIMAKAYAAADKGRITWREAALVDGALRAQQVPDSGLLSKIMQ
jgi:hypothetical protein